MGGHHPPTKHTQTPRGASILRPRVCRSLRRLDGWPVSRRTIGRGDGMPRNVKVVQTFKQLVKSSQLACHGAWRPETSFVSTPAARRPVGPSRPRIAFRVYCPLGIRTMLPVGLSAKDLDEMKPALLTRGHVMSCAYFGVSVSFCSKGNALLALALHNFFPYQSVLV